MRNMFNLLQILAPLPIGFAVFLVHLATIPITGTGINPARSLGAAIIYNKEHAWDDHVSVYIYIYLSFFYSKPIQKYIIIRGGWKHLVKCLFYLQWIFWVGPFIGAFLAAVYHQIVIRAIPFKTTAKFFRNF